MHANFKFTGWYEKQTLDLMPSWPLLRESAIFQSIESFKIQLFCGTKVPFDIYLFSTILNNSCRFEKTQVFEHFTIRRKV